MDHSEMVALIRGGVDGGAAWADLGAGTGNFTWALAQLLAPGSTIYAIDRDGKAIRAQRERLMRDPVSVQIEPAQADFVQPLVLPPLDGVLIANALHFARDHRAVLHRISGYLRGGGRLLVVEYEVDAALRYVPYPLPFAWFAALTAELGFGTARLVGARRSPSSGMEMYAAVAEVGAH